MKKITLYLVTILSVGSCVSSPKSPSQNMETERPLCNEKRPIQKYVWTISFSQRVPGGYELPKMSDFIRSRSTLQENVTQSIVQGFILLSSNRGRYSAMSSSQKNNALSTHAWYIANERNAALIETGPSNFIFCLGNECEGLKDPQTNKIVGKYAEEGRPFYYVEGIIDPKDEKYSDHKKSTYTYPSPAYVEWQDYFGRHPFKGGDFLDEHYFSIPDTKKVAMCLQAGFEENCFAPPKYDDHNRFIAPVKCNIQEWDCFSKFKQSAPFRVQFLQDHRGMCGSSCFDQINELLKNLSQDPFVRLEWEDAIAKDIFLKLSTSVTRKVEKDWIIARIEWNPTLFCQYANPKSNLISK